MNRHSADYIFWENLIKEYNIRINSLKIFSPNFREINSIDVVERNYISFIDIINWLSLIFKKEAIEEFVSKPYFTI